MFYFVQLYHNLNKEHYRPKHLFKTKRILLIVFVSSMLLLYLFPANSLPKISKRELLLVCFIYSTLICCSLLLSFTITKPTSSAKWTYLKEISLLTFTVSMSYISIMVTTYFVFPKFISQSFLIESFLNALLFGIVIYSVLNLYDLVSYLQNETPLHLDYNDTTLLKIKGKNKDEILTLPLENFVYIKSEGHYISVFYVEKGKSKLRNVLFRAKISEIEKSLEAYTTIVRCHKCYLLNTLHIKYINSYNKKYYAVLKNINQRIPISSEEAEKLAKIQIAV